MALRETARQCNIFVLFQSRLVYVGLIGPLPQLSSFLYRYVSFLFHMPYAFMVFAFIPSFTRMFIGFGFITGFVSCSCEVPIGALIDDAILFLSVFWFGHGWYCGCLSVIWRAFFIVWFGSERRVTAKFSSSELSSHQKAHPNLFGLAIQELPIGIPRLFISQASMCAFATCGTTTAKGLYANLFFVLTHYAIGGVSAQCIFFALSTPLRLRGRIGVFRRREGSASQPFLRAPLLRLLALCLRYEALLIPRVAAGGSGWGPSSLLHQVRVHR